MGEVSADWLITGRPFERDQAEYPESQLKMIEGKYGTWNDAKFALGFSEAEVASWVKDKKKILEVGPGDGTSFFQLQQLGVDVRALEPSLAASDKYREIARVKAIFSQVRDLVVGIKAVDAEYAFPGERFDVIFAIGPNFQNYSYSPEGFLSQLIGLVAVLKEDESSFISFQVPKNKENMALYVTTHQAFDLFGFLEQNSIEYQVREFMDDFSLDAQAIRLHRIQKGKDILPILINALQSQRLPVVASEH